MEKISEFVGKKKKQTKTCSVFDLTINTNKSLNSRDSKTLERLPEIKECLKELGHKLLKQNLVEKFLVDMPASLEAKKNVSPRILEFESNAQIESNTEKYGMLHMHVIYSIVHETKIKFDLPLLKKVIYKFLEKCLTFDKKYFKPYIHIRGRKDDAFSMREYINNKNGEIIF